MDTPDLELSHVNSSLTGSDAKSLYRAFESGPSRSRSLRSGIESANGQEGPMATILEFRASCDEAAPRPRRRKGPSAEIVIFPGIRYERWRENDASSEVGCKATTRDVLKLVD
jgi:hypothetical protein